jgi:hypothetical protein
MDEAYFFFHDPAAKCGRRRGESIELEVDSGSNDRERMLHREEHLHLLEVSHRLWTRNTLCILESYCCWRTGGRPFLECITSSANNKEGRLFMIALHHGQVDNYVLPFCLQLR